MPQRELSSGIYVVWPILAFLIAAASHAGLLLVSDVVAAQMLSVLEAE
jgi:hypothetical protein